MATPQILVLIFQVRVLAAERERDVSRSVVYSGVLTSVFCKERDRGIVTGTAQDFQNGTDPSAVTAVFVLAAGQGTRMRSTLPKVMHPLAGKPLLWHALRAAADLQPRQLVAVLGHGREQIEEFLANDAALTALPITTALQADQRGTGHAVQCALAATGPLAGTVIVSYGDVPLLTGQTLAQLARRHTEDGNAVTVLSAVVPDPTGYGRIVRDASGAVRAIVEQRDADAATQAITEINTGVYAFDGAILSELITRISDDNAQGELYVTDVLKLAVDAGHPVGALVAADASETEGVNDRAQLADMNARMRARLVRAAALSGVTVTDPAATYLDVDVQIGPDSLIEPGTHILAGTVVGSGCVIGPDTTLAACTVEDDAHVIRSHCEESRIRAGAQVGPYTHLRVGSDIGEGAQVGAYVEIKKSTIGAGVKAHHLAYLGDTTIGEHANIGAGAITANYDGTHKYPSTIGAHAFIGTNATLVTPVTIGDGGFVAAGSTITKDVEPGDLAVGRGQQRNIRDWVLRRRAGTATADAAEKARAADISSYPAGTPADDSHPQKGHPAS